MDVHLHMMLNSNKKNYFLMLVHGRMGALGRYGDR